MTTMTTVEAPITTAEAPVEALATTDHKLASDRAAAIGRIAKAAAVAAAVAASKDASVERSIARLNFVGDAVGEARKELSREFNEECRETDYREAHNLLLSVTLKRHGKRFLASGCTDRLAFKGELRVVDSLGDVADGTQVTVRLARRDSRPDKRGKITTTFAVQSMGTTTQGRIALAGHLSVSRYVRRPVSSL